VILTAQSGGTDPSPVSISFSNQNGLALKYNTTRTTDQKLPDGSDWFTQIPPNGDVAVGGISLQGKLSQLQPGVYRGTLGIGFSDGNAHTVQVLALVTASGTSAAGAAVRSQSVRPLSAGTICPPMSAFGRLQ
jgi:hypothetical protein